MKLITALAFLFVLIAAAAATSEEMESRCRREMQQHSLDKCRSFMKYGRQRGDILMGVGDNEGAPEECCMQLRRMREECRCPMIRDMMREMLEEEGFRGQECRGRCGEMMMRGKFLPAMCSVEPHTCRMSQGGGYY